MTTVWANRVAVAEPERMVTFTKIGATRPEIRLILQQVVRDLRKRKFAFEYWGVIELHQSGVPHIHVLQKGSFIPKRVLTEVCGLFGWGHSDIRRCDKGFSAAAYCGKHLCHSHGRRWDGRLIRYSKAFFEKDCAQADLKEATKELSFSVCFGRADALAAKYRARGELVELGELGDDWIMGESKINGEIYRRYSRNEKKGYTQAAANFDEFSHEYEDKRFTNKTVMTKKGLRRDAKDETTPSDI